MLETGNFLCVDIEKFNAPREKDILVLFTTPRAAVVDPRGATLLNLLIDVRRNFDGDPNLELLLADI